MIQTMSQAEANDQRMANCPDCKGWGMRPCAHTEMDAEGWCVECDTPAEETNTRVVCECQD